jgi:hypothetical protein
VNLTEIDRERLRRRATVERREAELDAAVQELKNLAQHQLALGEHVARHPYRMLGGALLFGIWLGS